MSLDVDEEEMKKLRKALKPVDFEGADKPIARRHGAVSMSKVRKVVEDKGDMDKTFIDITEPPPKKKSFWSRTRTNPHNWDWSEGAFKRDIHTARRGAEKGVKYGSKAKKYGYHGAKEGVAFTERNIKRAGSTMGRIGGAIAGLPLAQPINIFVTAWHNMSETLKGLLALVFFVVLLFVPWGIFQYTGWAVFAAFAFLINSIYWVFINIFNGAASLIIAVINGIISILIGVIAFLVNAVFNVLGVPKWTAGEQLIANSLIHYDEIADIPHLMTIATPKFSHYETIIDKIMEWLGIKFSLGFLWQPVLERMEDWASSSSTPIYGPIAIGLIPVGIIIGVIYLVYRKGKYG